MVYTIDEHRHRFAAWAAGSAASFVGSSLKVKSGKAILEEVGFPRLIVNPETLPLPQDMDCCHKKWRDKVIQAATGHGLAFTHGVAAKLINIYLKAAFVCGGYHNHERVRALHPPIDSLLLKEMARQNAGGQRTFWSAAALTGWSKFDSGTYETVIHFLRMTMGNRPLWEVEQYWREYQ